ncbi:terminase large subunit domain-containing protein [Sinisalibacter lacisalsi]|uniref:Terminase n=1 Tax=Sinisalibacter lacisalsi TaxID=1526570 RepID=A0ABQ1QLR3_9RHOB|nr:terminase family protein [Sinisalibacter lacisalsi]GGD30220.1 hypothetical protein GCM10011358_12830 [Sinisalibacter lacisalsi]
MEARIIWQPHSRQAEFLAADEAEVLYGGAVGGGKTDALLVDALCLGHPSGGVQHPKHAAVILRRSKPELQELIVRANALYPAIIPGAIYRKSEYCWFFPSGARVEFNHVRDGQDAQRFKGRQWNYIGFDELTLFAEQVWRVLSTRCRTSAPELALYMRATTNPDGPGQAWVMRYFGIGEDGGAVRREIEVIDKARGVRSRLYRRFIPARLQDNPTLDETGYRKNLLMLPPAERAALLEGRWQPSLPEGAYYAGEMERLSREGRLCAVPYDPGLPVNTFWDLGMNDQTAIWFHQRVGSEDRFIDCYEASGESLEHYAQILLARGYNLGGVHYLPHDAEVRSLHTGKTNRQMLEELLPGLVFDVVPRVSGLLAGINATRLKLGGKVYFDKEKTAFGIEALRNYRKAFDPRQEVFRDRPVRDRHTHFADALRQWGQIDGPAGPLAPGKRRRSRPGAMAV